MIDSAAVAREITRALEIVGQQYATFSWCLAAKAPQSSRPNLDLTNRVRLSNGHFVDALDRPRPLASLVNEVSNAPLEVSNAPPVR